MVKVIKSTPMGVPDIVRFHDLTGTGTAPSFNPVSGTASPLTIAKDAVNSVDQWINIADKSITALGRIDSILARVQSIKQAPQQQQGPGPAPVQMERLPPGATRINSDPVVEAPAPVQQPAPAPVAPIAAPVPHVPVGAIVQALDMISTGQPGITVEELSAAIKRNPAQVQHIMDVFAAGSH